MMSKMLKPRSSPTLLFRSAGPTVDSKYNPSNQHPAVTGLPFKYTPKSFYMYYIDMDQNHPRVRHYFYPGGDDDINTSGLNDISVADLNNKMQEIINDALSAHPLNTHLMKIQNFASIQWKKISYVSFVVDIRGWSFVVEDQSNNSHPLLVMDKQGNYSGNTSFFDGAPVSLSDSRSAGSTLPGFHVTNHMTTNLNGDLLAAGQNQYFSFNLCFSVPYSPPIGSDPMVCVFDPGGENLGPPVGPP